MQALVQALVSLVLVWLRRRFGVFGIGATSGETTAAATAAPSGANGTFEEESYFFAGHTLRHCPWLLVDTTRVGVYCTPSQSAWTNCASICQSTIVSGNGTTSTTTYIEPLPPSPWSAWTLESLNGTIPAEYSERIVVPPLNPPLDDGVDTGTGERRTHCPHDSSATQSWHDATTWPDGIIPPTWDGQNVTLPTGVSIVLQAPLAFDVGVLTIPVGTDLILGEVNETTGGLHLRAHGIRVDGYLVAGSKTCRIATPIVVTLLGDRNDSNEKGIVVTGTLSLHGRYYRSWTRLARTAQVGDTQLLVPHAVGWTTGQDIVLVTTATKDSREWHRNEVVTIASVEPFRDDTRSNATATAAPYMSGSSIVTLQSSVQYQHLALPGYQAEVGLLSRTIVIQGSEFDSEPVDPDPGNCTLQGEGEEGDNGTTLPHRHGDTGAPCPNTHQTGYGGHVHIDGGQGGRAFVQGVQFVRMGQTNRPGRYPIFLDALGDSCPECYVRDSSFYQSYYRCVVVSQTNHVTIAENVAYDITGYCFLLETGSEHDNDVSFNLAAHIHAISSTDPPGATTASQFTDVYQSSPTLAMPADVTASAFFIPNVHNTIVGNAASGGWAGFIFPNFNTVMPSSGNNGDLSTEALRPSSATALRMDGNSAHSTGWWWDYAGAFYFGGSMSFYNDEWGGNVVLEYNPSRSFTHLRQPCLQNMCATALGGCDAACPDNQQTLLRITNSKAFQVASVGFVSWSGPMEVIGWESHDTGRSIESRASELWIDNMLAVCRTGDHLSLPTEPEPWDRIRGDGYVWYESDHKHILTRAVFRNCGYRSDAYNQYDASWDRGCGNDTMSACHQASSAFLFLTHSDTYTPTVMQGTRNITFDNCGRRYSLDNWLGNADTVSGRTQNWLDFDGTASGTNVPTYIVSGLDSVSEWWNVDSNVRNDEQGPLRFMSLYPGNNVSAPSRGLAHVLLQWDDALHSQVGTSTLCGNGNGAPCPTVGTVRHAGPRYSNGRGYPLTANGHVVGPVGGYGWIVDWSNGAPRTVTIRDIEVLPETPLLVSIAYPLGTNVTITAHAVPWCTEDASASVSCRETLTRAASLDEVRYGPGHSYYMDDQNVVTVRIAQLASNFVGRPEWFIPNRSDKGASGTYLARHFERWGVYLPIHSTDGAYYTLEASCDGDWSGDAYCWDTTERVVMYDPVVCPTGLDQYGYDYCCAVNGTDTTCVYASSAA